MWEIDPGGGNILSDRLAGEQVLFQVDPDTRPLRAELLRHFAGQRRAAVEEIIQHALIHTRTGARTCGRC
jgi:hypothetical protein